MISLPEQYTDVSPVSGEQTAQEAAETMLACGYNCLPLVEDSGHYVGMVRRSTATHAKPSTPCSDIVARAESIRADLAPTEALAYLTETTDDLLACTDRQGNLVGTIARNDMLRLTADLTASGPDGSTIGVSMRKEDYSLAKITSIVEQSGASVLSATTKRNATTVELLLKLSTTEAIPVCDALERYGYDACVYGEKQDDDESILRRNYNELMMYLNV